jgi:hypothetical protein
LTWPTTIEGWALAALTYLIVCAIFWRFTQKISVAILFLVTVPLIPGTFLVNFMAGAIDYLRESSRDE